MSHVLIRTDGKAGRITLARPEALNALTHDMCRTIAAALEAWRADDAVRLVIIDGQGERAFCAGGDVARICRAAAAGDASVGHAFWRDEYRMNVALAEYPKPVVAFLQGIVLGGGVGLGCHVSHRIVGETTRLAMPEVGIGLIPDVGGTRLLSRAPHRLGEYLGLTGLRMGPGDAIRTGFADCLVPERAWEALAAVLAATGDAGLIAAAAVPAPDSPLHAAGAEIEQAFAGPDVPAILAAQQASDARWAREGAEAMGRNSPLAMACTLVLLRSLPAMADLRSALTREFRVTWRSVLPGLTDFMEGVRAQIIDKDRQPKWRHATPADVPAIEVAALIASLGHDELLL
ncbi:enoyl-CoA hydratase/isomerase family protein [Ancylobacter amanitiformis]|uniref:3-hydroxyisobutyryl-CoA hydrolase n=1 Tax=Ancylobacter amanitiformis TaxID=217069 RepID=A0ABU0LKZ6_9HYPH|nr:enoyl-CoA hydratase/isomerase family protein [Ancylobacter amanitiformis]MDQ0509343.1 enoyl-CoA hydratase [Ancylobacter amanitiformis]